MACVVCDKCGCSVDESKATDIRRPFYFYGEQEHYFLCYDCTNKFDNWLKKKEAEHE